MDLEYLRKLNRFIDMNSVYDKSFYEYGRIVNNFDFKKSIDYMEKHTSIADNGNIYVAKDIELELLSPKELIEDDFYGEMPCQIGYCNGKNSTLNGLEYHKGSEIDVAATDMILLLGKIQNIINFKYNSENVKAFLVSKGTAVELYGTTLHFAPCKVCDEGFKCIVILPYGTNTALEKSSKCDPLLFAKNKWLLVHESRKVLLEKGAYLGIVGENIKINY